MDITIDIADMRFFDREAEFEKLREIEEISHDVAQFTIITGRRRIGKTEMVKVYIETFARCSKLLFCILQKKGCFTYTPAPFYSYQTMWPIYFAHKLPLDGRIYMLDKILVRFMK